MKRKGQQSREWVNNMRKARWGTYVPYPRAYITASCPYCSKEFRVEITCKGRNKKCCAGHYPRTKEINSKASASGKIASARPEVKARRSAAAKLRPPVTEETKQKISKSNSGENNFWFGKDRSGDKNPNWLGGIHQLPYHFNFDDEFKNRIRCRDNHTCQLCGKTKVEQGNSLCVHHIYYDKANNCSTEEDFITLCFKCNSKVNFNRDYWIEHLTRNSLVKVERI